MRLDLTIDDLVLDGFDVRARQQVVDAIQEELSDLRWPRAGSGRDDRRERDARTDVAGSPRAVARAVRESIGAALAGLSVR